MFGQSWSIPNFSSINWAWMFFGAFASPAQQQQYLDSTSNDSQAMTRGEL